MNPVVSPKLVERKKRGVSLKPSKVSTLRRTNLDLGEKDAIEIVKDIEKFDEEYTILERIGQGKYGSVYKAKHIRTNTFVAVKNLHAHPQDAEELIKEIEIMESIDCENIVRYYGTFWKENSCFIIMEYCYYGSCGDIMSLRHQPFKENEVAVICKDVLKGLEYLHKYDKVHRDVKADNILVNVRSQFKLADFGVCGKGNKLKTVIGTPFFVAPEVILNNGYYDSKVDIWSLGITAIELAEMEPPDGSDPPMKVLFNIPTRPTPTLSDPHRHSLEFNDFIFRCLTKDPSKRPTASELLQHPFILQTCNSDNFEVMKHILDETDQLIESYLNSEEPIFVDDQLAEQENNESEMEIYSPLIATSWSGSAQLADDKSPRALRRKNSENNSNQNSWWQFLEEQLKDELDNDQNKRKNEIDKTSRSSSFQKSEDNQREKLSSLSPRRDNGIMQRTSPSKEKEKKGMFGKIFGQRKRTNSKIQ